MTSIVQGKEQAESVLQRILIGMGFAGFCFDTSFTLRFTRDDVVEDLPWCIELRLLSDWWFDAWEQWEERVARQSPPGAAQPEEPVQALELAHLRWVQGTTITNVSLSDQELKVSFANSRTISASTKDDEGGLCWEMVEAGAVEPTTKWLVTCSEGEVFSRSVLQG